MIVEIKCGDEIFPIDTTKLKPTIRQKALAYGLRTMVLDATALERDPERKKRATRAKLRTMLKEQK